MFGQRQICFVWILLAIMSVLLEMAGAAVAVEVTFADPNLEAVIRNALDIQVPASITDTDMQTMVGLLDASRCSISNIEGLEYATNLTDLRLHYNQISNISAVSGLTNLNKLYLNENHISDVSALAGLTNLATLYLSNNQISDISVLAGLTNLTCLGLGHNQISNISAVAGLSNLTVLELDNNQISDISVVAGLANLWGVDLTYNQIEIMNFSNANLPSLDAFDIEGNPLKDVFLAEAMLNQISFNALMNGGTIGASFLDGIADICGVLTLDMGGVDFSDISDLSAMYTMDDLETLLLANATNLEGSQVVSLVFELDSLNWLDVRGLWDNFNVFERYTLNAWNAAEGNTLITVSISIPGDVNHDELVNEVDAQIMAEQWGIDGTGGTYSADINDDGQVNAVDASIMAANWGDYTEGRESNVPEPGILALLTTGLLAASFRFRHRFLNATTL